MKFDPASFDAHLNAFVGNSDSWMYRICEPAADTLGWGMIGCTNSAQYLLREARLAPYKSARHVKWEAAPWLWTPGLPRQQTGSVRDLWYCAEQAQCEGSAPWFALTHYSNNRCKSPNTVYFIENHDLCHGWFSCSRRIRSMVDLKVMNQSRKCLFWHSWFIQFTISAITLFPISGFCGQYDIDFFIHRPRYLVKLENSCFAKFIFR